jgi:hypothetical protein
MLRNQPSIYLEELRKRKPSFKITGFRVGNRTLDLPNTKQRWQRLNSKLRCFVARGCVSYRNQTSDWNDGIFTNDKYTSEEILVASFNPFVCCNPSGSEWWFAEQSWALDALLRGQCQVQLLRLTDFETLCNNDCHDLQAQLSEGRCKMSKVKKK